MDEVVSVRTDLKTYLNKHSSALQSVASATITPERMVRLVCAAASRDPLLAECTPLSILRSMMQAAELGLEVCSGLQEAHLVPRWNKKGNGGKGCREATFLPGYQGLIRLAIESGGVRNIEARLVYANDVFDHEQGTQPKITHKPTLSPDRGDIVAVYAVAFMPEGGTTFEVMTRADIDAIMRRGRDGSDGFSPWKSDYGEMARKTVVRRLAKYLPKKSSAFSKALELQAKSEVGFIEGEVLSYDDEVTKTMDADGNLAIEWSDQDREEAKAFLNDCCDTLLSEGVDEETINTIRDDHRLRIGDPESSPRQWSNRVSGAVDRAIAKRRNK